MRTKIMIILSVLVLAALNFGIYQKEQIMKHGETLLLELAPVDPRSLIQGDYMRLRYRIESSVSSDELPSHKKRGYMVIRPDENNIARFVRFHDRENLTKGEKLLHFHKKNHSLHIVPDSFFFQEGHAKHYEEAKYGVFKFSDSGEHLLIGLAGENKRLIKPL